MNNKPPLNLLKIGGKLLDDEKKLAAALHDFSEIRTPKVLVHGGGKKASELCQALGIKPQMWQGRRITDEPTLRVVTMVYAGLLSKTVVSQLQSFGCNAIGLSGADGNVIEAVKRPVNEVDFGYAGDLKRINKKLIITLLDTGFTPVFCAITHNGKGQLLNTNADTIATALAIALNDDFEVNLKYVFEKNGVLADPADDRSVLKELNSQAYSTHRKSGAIADGMIPKLDNAFAAKKASVSSVIICGTEGINQKIGTEICL